jgi:hypothetical protein
MVTQNENTVLDRPAIESDALFESNVLVLSGLKGDPP